jgi:integrase/recombinase XerD
VPEIELAGTVLPPVAGDPSGALRQATFAWLLAQGSINTRNAYRRDVTGIGQNGKPAKMPVPAWLPWCDLNRIDPLTARRGHVDLYARLIQAAGQSPATQSRKLSAISSWYDYLIDEGLTDRNPAKKATRPAIDRDVSPAVGLSENEINRLLDQAEADGPRTEALIKLLYFGGFRVGSILAASVRDLGWEQDDRTLRLVLKGGKERRVIIEDEAGDALDRYMATRLDAREDAPLFATGAGEPLDEPYCWRLVRRLARQAGIKSHAQLNPHALRHAHATHARDEGVPLEVVQETLGHVDQRTTLRYDRARFRRKRRSGTVLSERRRRAREDRQG